LIVSMPVSSGVGPKHQSAPTASTFGLAKACP
jgi:hypothetical protein